MQVLGIVAISAWTLSINFLVFMGLRKIGWLRVSRESEEQGLDFSQSVGTGRDPLLDRFNHCTSQLDYGSP
jgi:ammonia channel protein AmtB